MSDSFTPDAGQRITPDGRVSYDFDGHVHARGLDIDAGATDTPPDDRRVRWLRTSDGAAVAEIFGYDGGTLSGIDVRAVDLGDQAISRLTAEGPAAVALLRASAGTFETTTEVAIGADSRALLRSDGASNYVMQGASGAPGKITIAGIVTIDSSALDPGDEAFADITHNLGKTVYALGARQDPLSFGYDIGWGYVNTSANVTRFYFNNVGTHVGAQLRLNAFLLTTT